MRRLHILFFVLFFYTKKCVRKSTLISPSSLNSAFEYYNNAGVPKMGLAPLRECAELQDEWIKHNAV